MNREILTRSMTASEYAELIDSAKARAIELRRAAVRDFWADVAKRLHRVWQGVRRAVAATRLGTDLRKLPAPR